MRLKSLIYTLMLISASLICRAQQGTAECQAVTDTMLQKKVFEFVEKPPQYPGGMDEVVKFFFKHYRVPSEEEWTQYSLRLYYIVDEAGRVSHAGVYAKRPSEYSKMEKEGIRTLLLMKNWKPGECGGKKVAVRMVLPIQCLMPQYD